MRKTLIIYETTHTENLSALLVLADKYFSGITVYIPGAYYEQALYIVRNIHLQNEIQWVLQENESHKEFITAFCKAARHCTHLHINTLEHNVLFFTMQLRRLKQVEISMTVHSINDYSTFLFNGLRNISESIAKVFLHKIIRHYRVLAPGMVATFQKHFPSATVDFIPGNFYNPGFDGYKKQADFFTIIIPGSIEEKRRNYKLVLSFLQKNIQALSAITPIRVILAGSANTAYGKQVINALQQLENDRFSLVYFAEVVPQEQFDGMYKTADITWSPINLRMTSLRGVAEINGITHSPGIITDQIYFGKPAVITKGLELPEIMQGCNFEYETEDELAAIFFSLVSDPKNKEAMSAALKQACQYFQPSNFDAAFKTLMNLDAPKA